jgi:hypothetical protein
MTSISIADAALKVLATKFIDFKYIALDSDPTPYVTSQTGPISELTSLGAQRAGANASADANTGIVTMTLQFIFTGNVTVNAICPMNDPSAGNGVCLYRFLPPAGILPASFSSGGSLLVTITCSMARGS